MASPEEKEEKKAAAAKAKELRSAGVVPIRRSFHLEAGQRVRTAWAWIPRLRWVIAVSSLISVAAMGASLVSVYSRTAPMIFLSLPDGTIACGPSSDAQGHPMQRKTAQQKLCDRLVPPVGLESTAGPSQEVP